MGVSITITENNKRTAVIAITELNPGNKSELADYKVVIQVDCGADIFKVHTRTLERFPKNALNSVALLKAALAIFPAESLGLDDDYDPDETVSSSAVERRQLRTMQEIQAGTSQLRDNGSTIWS